MRSQKGAITSLAKTAKMSFVIHVGSITIRLMDDLKRHVSAVFFKVNRKMQKIFTFLRSFMAGILSKQITLEEKQLQEI